MNRGQSRPELEREHGAGDGADREQDRRGLRPLAGERQGDRVVVLATPVLGDQHDRRQRDPDAGDDDVEPERERHQVPGGQQVVGEDQRVHGLMVPGCDQFLW